MLSYVPSKCHSLYAHGIIIASRCSALCREYSIFPMRLHRTTQCLAELLLRRVLTAQLDITAEFDRIIPGMMLACTFAAIIERYVMLATAA